MAEANSPRKDNPKLQLVQDIVMALKRDGRVFGSTGARGHRPDRRRHAALSEGSLPPWLPLKFCYQIGLGDAALAGACADPCLRRSAIFNESTAHGSDG
jgi:hypothetical protein